LTAEKKAYVSVVPPEETRFVSGIQTTAPSPIGSSSTQSTSPPLLEAGQ
jgi:hypothetical protein